MNVLWSIEAICELCGLTGKIITQMVGKCIRRIGPAHQPGAVLAVAVAGLLSVITLHANAMTFSLPLDCDYGRNCFIQNYVDADPGEGYSDYRCGYLSYDDHKGTDFRLPGRNAMIAGVPVVAAAPGVVKAIRDGMPDISIRKIDRKLIKGREAGNGVLIDHGNGWQTQYSHMRQGSIRVRTGETVTAGTPLGEVGLSGNTEFPHLHFTVRRHGKVIDPFSGQEPGAGCNNIRASLWDSDTKKRLRYFSSGVLETGFTNKAPQARPLFEHIDNVDKLPSSAGQIIFWTHIYGARKGDTQEMILLGPDNNVLGKRSIVVPQNQARRFAMLRVGRPGGSLWPTGNYRGVYRLVRAVGGNTANEIINREIRLTVTSD